MLLLFKSNNYHKSVSLYQQDGFFNPDGPKAYGEILRFFSRDYLTSTCFIEVVWTLFISQKKIAPNNLKRVEKFSLNKKL
jgi:hypothetical protein